MVEEFSELKPSQYCRLAIKEKLIRDGLMQHPAAVHFNNNHSQKVAAE
jgi:hypothetical protein